LAEVRQDCALWSWDAEGLSVAFYPLDREQEVKAKRDAGKRGGMARTQAKSQAARDNGAKHQPKQNPSRTEAQPKLEPNKKERKGLGIVREGGDLQKVESTPALSEFLAEAQKIGVEADIATEIWHDNESRPITPYGQWTDYRGNPIAKWSANLMARASQIRARRGGGNITKLNGNAKPEGVWQIKQRIEAAEKEISRLQGDPRNKESADEHTPWDRRIKPAVAAQIGKLKAGIAAMRQQLAGQEVAA